MNVISYRGYHARLEFDPDDHIFVGHLAGINDVVGFHSDTVAGLEAAFQEATDDYLEACARAGKTPEKPYSGQVMFRIDPATHARAALAAQLRGLSLNLWAEEALRQRADAEIPGQAGS